MQEFNNPHRSKGHLPLAKQLIKAIALSLCPKNTARFRYTTKFVHPQSWDMNEYKPKNNCDKGLLNAANLLT